MKILIIEDEPKTAQSIRQALEESRFDVDVAYDGHFGLRLAKENEYDMIISDIIIPYINGIELCKQLRNLGIQTPILLLTALGGTDDIVTGFDSGADDYLTKPFDFKELIARVKSLLKRGGNVTNMANLIKVADVEMNVDMKTVTRAGKRIELTAKEFSLLEYFIRNKHRVVSKAELAEKVWEIDFDTGTNVIEVYVNYLRRKIDKGFPTKLIHTQFGMGYILKDDE